MLKINAVLRVAPGNETCFEGMVRVIRVSSDGRVCLVRLDLPEPGSPFVRSLTHILNAIKQKAVLTGQVFDAKLPKTAEGLSEAEQRVYATRLAVVGELVRDDKIYFDSNFRTRAYRECATNLSVKLTTVRRAFERYLWGGQIDTALVPEFSKCGSRGKHQKPGSKRRGPRVRAGEPASDVILPDVREKLEKGADEFYMSGKYTLLEAFVATKEKYFSVGGTLVSGSDGKKRLQDILPPSHELPTRRQFRYVCETLERAKGKRKSLPRQLGTRKPDRTRRGTALQGIPGPGYRFEIDGSKWQTQLVSRYGRARLIGNPSVYFIVDVWSTCYTGYAFSLEHEGWPLAASALYNAFTPKDAVFKRLNLPYTSEEWPCHHLPTKLCADRGPLVSNRAGVVPDIGVIVEITPSMMADAKGTIEGAINEAKHRHSYKLPGAYRKFRVRRDPDGKATAAMYPDELETILVDILLDLNNEPVPLARIPPDMVAQGIKEVTRVGLWKWGLQNYPGHTRELPSTTVFSALLCRETARVTPKGLVFRNQTYLCPQLATNGYLARAASRGPWSTSVGYLEHDASNLWFLDSESDTWVHASNLSDNVARHHAAFYELEGFRRDAERLRAQAKEENAHQRIAKARGHAQTIRNATSEAMQERRGKSRSANKKDIRSNRELDLAAERVAKSAVAATTLAGTPPASQGTSPGTAGSKHEASTDSRAITVTARSLELWRQLNGRHSK